jgi:hypothetical protein
VTARRGDIADLPDWPRGLSLEQASAYVGVSGGTFRRHVKIAPREIGGRLVWDRHQLDAWFDFTGTQTEHALSPKLGDLAAQWGKSK